MLRIVGGHLALDLINTVAPREPGGEDFIATPAALAEWSGRVGVAPAGSPDPAGFPSAAAHAAALAVREATYDVLTSGSAAAASTLGRFWADAAARSRLVPTGSGARLEVGVSGDMAIPDRLAEAAIDLLTRADLSRLKVCPPDRGGCGWLFLDRSRNGSRLWCTMDDCGTHAKSRRLTAKRRAVRLSGAAE
jgi:predicted RNA-binding Zn ribbon-like protein